MILTKRIIIVFLLASALGACGTVKPWVKAYERANLGKAVMQSSRTLPADSFREHVYETRGAARGATGIKGGGCGCN